MSTAEQLIRMTNEAFACGVVIPGKPYPGVIDYPELAAALSKAALNQQEAQGCTEENSTLRHQFVEYKEPAPHNHCVKCGYRQWMHPEDKRKYEPPQQPGGDADVYFETLCCILTGKYPTELDREEDARHTFNTAIAQATEKERERCAGICEARAEKHDLEAKKTGSEKNRDYHGSCRAALQRAAQAIRAQAEGEK